MDDELNGMRIRQLAALRRAAYRTRSYCVIAFGACAVTAVQLIVNAIHRLDGHQPLLRPILYLCGSVVLLAAAAYFCHLTLRFHREAKISPPAPPAHPPDFSKLSDGSQRVRNLERL
jgi:hypothetical protein